MTKKKFARIACVLALTGVLGSAAALSGCTIETDHPEATIKIEFNGSTYELNYKLYRKMYPQTVRHFIELVESGFYNNTIIHNYNSSYWYGGGYSYDADNYATDYENGDMSSYLEDNSKELAYLNLFRAGKFTASVYLDHIVGSYREALPTLIGEFSSNDHRIEPDTSLKSSYGCLRMYYTEKDTKETVYLNKTGSEDLVLVHEYGYNSATSLFNIQVSSSTSSDSNYCIFAVLQNTDTLSDLQNDISDYISEQSLTSFTSTAELEVDLYDMITEPQQVTYTTTAAPIVIKSVTITKY